MIGYKVYDWSAKYLRCNTYGQIKNSQLQEKAAIEGGRLISGREIRICKLKIRNKSHCVREGARQGAQ